MLGLPEPTFALNFLTGFRVMVRAGFGPDFIRFV
jgi:hypothetical protein